MEISNEKIVIISILINIILLIFLAIERARRICAENVIINENKVKAYYPDDAESNIEYYVFIEYAIEYKKYEIHPEFKTFSVNTRGGMLIPQFIIKDIDNK